jgi:hypothetical protein
MLAFTRPLLDWHVRRRVAADPQVTILEGTEIVRLMPDARGRGVAGVVVRRRADAGADASPEEFLSADLVVDAGGRGSRAPQWLADLGYAPPRETTISAFIGYASRLYRIPPGFKADWKMAYVQCAPPRRTRGGIMIPVEGDRWLLTLVGGGRDYPPTDEAGFLQFARGLASPILYDAVRDAEPASPISGNRATANRVRHFQKRLAKVNSAPWLLATGEDFRYAETEGGRPTLSTRLMHRYMDSVVSLTTKDEGVRRTLLEAFHMLRTPAALFRPGIALRVMAQALQPPSRSRALATTTNAVGDASAS